MATRIARLVMIRIRNDAWLIRDTRHAAKGRLKIDVQHFIVDFTIIFETHIVQLVMIRYNCKSYSTVSND